jgi:hypothetical protein
MSPPAIGIEQDTTMTLTANRTPRARHPALRIGLVLLSAILTLGALVEHFPGAFDWIHAA